MRNCGHLVKTEYCTHSPLHTQFRSTRHLCAISRLLAESASANDWPFLRDPSETMSQANNIVLFENNISTQQTSAYFGGEVQVSCHSFAAFAISGLACVDNDPTSSLNCKNGGLFLRIENTQLDLCRQRNALSPCHPILRASCSVVLSWEFTNLPLSISLW